MIPWFWSRLRIKCKWRYVGSWRKSIYSPRMNIFHITRRRSARIYPQLENHCSNDNSNSDIILKRTWRRTRIRWIIQKSCLTIFLCKVSSSQSPRDKRHRLNFMLWRFDGELEVKYLLVSRRNWSVWLFDFVPHLSYRVWTSLLSIINWIDIYTSFVKKENESLPTLAGLGSDSFEKHYVQDKNEFDNDVGNNKHEVRVGVDCRHTKMEGGRHQESRWRDSIVGDVMYSTIWEIDRSNRWVWRDCCHGSSVAKLDDDDA